MAALREENPRNLLGVHLDGHRIVSGAIQNGGNLTCNAHTAGGVLGELAHAGLGYDYF
jgi:serine protease inhibitor ecotin